MGTTLPSSSLPANNHPKKHCGAPFINNITLPKRQTPISSRAVPDPSWCQVGLRALAQRVRQADCSVALTRTSVPGRLHSGR